MLRKKEDMCLEPFNVLRVTLGMLFASARLPSKSCIYIYIYIYIRVIMCITIIIITIISIVSIIIIMYIYIYIHIYIYIYVYIHRTGRSLSELPCVVHGSKHESE